MMSSGLLSADLKFVRAEKHIQAIKDCLTNYRSREPYKIIPEPNGNATLEITEKPPVDVSVLAGEAIYQIRSALDHLMFELIKRNPSNVTLPVRWDEKCEFPIRFHLPKGISEPPVPYDKFTEVARLYGVAKDAAVFIERLQPYYPYPAGIVSLGVIGMLSNIDKHRYLNLTVSRLTRSEHVVSTSDRSMVGPGIYEFGLETGAQLKPLIAAEEMPAGEVEVERQFFPDVAFNEPRITGDLWRFASIEQTLKTLLNFAQGFVGLGFAQFFSKSSG